MTALDVVVVGGGISGLASAALLAADGHRVTLLESRDAFGGRAGSWERDGFRFDTGPSWFLMPEVVEHFYRLLGTSMAAQLELRTLDPGYRAYFEGDPTPFDLPAGSARARAALTALDPPSEPGLARYLDSAGSTYELALRRFLYSSFDSVRPFLGRQVLGGVPRLGRMMLRSLDSEIRAHTREARLRRLLGYPAVFLGGSPLRVPGMYHLMSHLDVDEGVLYPMGGFAAVVQSFVRLARSAGADLHTSATVERIVAAGGQARGVRYRDARGAPHLRLADLVVTAADLHHVDTELLDARHRERDARWWSRRDPGPGAVIAMLGVRGRVPQLAHHTLLLADDWEGAFASVASNATGFPTNPSLYIGKPSATDPDVAPPDHENLFVLVPVAADTTTGRGGIDRAGDPRVEHFVDGVIAQIAGWTGAHDLAERVVVRRTVAPADFAGELRSWRGSALGPAHTLRQSAFFRASNASRRVAGLLHAGGSTIPGIGVPMCLISAELVLKRVRGDRSASPVVEPLGVRP
jgi:phytoene desaturase